MKSASAGYFISSGEYSGDLLAADLVLAINEQMPDLLPFGIGGEASRRAGVEILVPQETLGVMGVVEVAKRLAEIRMLESFILQKISDRRPAFAVLVDYPAFHLRLASQLKMRGIPVIQYVAPKVWAWGEKRLENLRRDFSLVLGVLPFEKEFFERQGVNYHLVGSPHKDRIRKVIVNRKSLGFENAKPIIGLLPGSRVTEIAAIFPKMLEIKNRFIRENPSALFVMPLASNLSVHDFCEAVGADSAEIMSDPKYPGSQVYRGIHIFRGMSLELMSVADVALVASGTATLECALIGTPMVVIYVMNSITYEIAKRKVRIPYISLVNLISGQEVVKEFVQEFSATEVAEELSQLAQNSAKRAAMLAHFNVMTDALPSNASETAARAIKSFLAENIRQV